MTQNGNFDFDVGIVGGGPAGLSAAVMLGRARRRVVVFDHGRPRNRAALAVHGYLGLDGTTPNDLRERGRREAASYGVTFVGGEATAARRALDRGGQGGFELRTAGGDVFGVRKLLLATGVIDEVPEIEGLADFYGRSVHHCPYCDGWEHRDQRLVALADGRDVVELAAALLGWSPRVTACTNGEALATSDCQELAVLGVDVRSEALVRLEGEGGQLQRVVFAQPPPLACDALFFSAGQRQASRLLESLGCERTEKGQIPTYGKQGTDCPGLFVAGDADGDVQFAIVAAAEGAIAATAINAELVEEWRAARKSPVRTSTRDQLC
jgi:thioredoxin reductase